MQITTYGTAEHPAILLLHTMFTTGAMFEKFIPALQDQFFVVIPTLDGYDPETDADYPGADEELEQIEAFLQKNNIRALAAATGSSLGAMLAWRLWQRGQVSIRRLVLDSPPFGWDAAVAQQNAKLFWQLVQAVRAAPHTPCIFDKRYGEFGPMMRRSCTRLTETTIRRSCESCFGPRLPEQLSPGETKILLVYGEDDPNYQSQKNPLKAQSQLTLVVKPGCGHCDFLMRNPLQFAELLKEES